MTKELMIEGRPVQVIPVGEHYLGAVEVDGVMTVFRMNDSGDGPSDADFDCLLCKISNIGDCQRRIPPGTPDDEVRGKLDECVAQACAGRCTGPAGGGGVLIMYRSAR